MRAILLIMIWSALLHAELTRDATTGIVSDSATGLQWQDDEVGDEATWEDAIDRCETLTLGGYNDWRLPNINELKSIIDRSKVDPAIKDGFENVSSCNYWSSTTSDEYRHGAWRVVFSDGRVYFYDKDSNYYVRCVRAGE